MTDNALKYCEAHGIYELWKERGNVITYYSWYGDDLERPFLKVEHNIKTGNEKRKRLRFRTAPKFLVGRYNYCCG